MNDYDDSELDGEDDEYTDAGTILRPLDAATGYHADWQRDPKRKLRPMFDPTIRWGDSVVLEAPINASATAFTADLLNVTFGQSKGQTCRIGFHAEVVEQGLVFPVVLSTAVQLVVGCGSQMTSVKRAFSLLPQNEVAVDAVWELPVMNIRGRVLLRGNDVKVRYALWLVPIVGADVDG